MAVAALVATSALAQETIGVVKRSKGEVAIERAGMQIAPKPGTEVLRGDHLVTGPDGYASLSMSRAAAISVGPSTEVALDHYAAENSTASRLAPRILQSLASFFAVNRQR